MKDMTIILKNEPGMLADMGEKLGTMGINMEGLCGIPVQDEAFVHILVEDETTAKWALEEGGFEVRAIREVLIVDIGNFAGKPGSGGKIARKIGDSGINIDLVYLAENNRLILGVDDIVKARRIIDKLAPQQV